MLQMKVSDVEVQIIGVKIGSHILPYKIINWPLG